jgi:hypothetical protein
VALAAAMSRHPAAGARALSQSSLVASAGGPPSFATVAALLTGPWRVNDPVAFAAAMRAAPIVAGHPVVDLFAMARQPTVGFDPLSAAVAGHLELAVGAATDRSALAVRWVAARGGRFLFVEAAARCPADTQGPELLILAHLVEPGDDGPGAALSSSDDDSWLVAVVGDGQGGVTGIGRAAVPREAESDFHRRPAWASPAGSRLPAKLNLTALRSRLAGPARAAEGLAPQNEETPIEAVVLPFRR